MWRWWAWELERSEHRIAIATGNLRTEKDRAVNNNQEVRDSGSLSPDSLCLRNEATRKVLSRQFSGFPERLRSIESTGELQPMTDDRGLKNWRETELPSPSAQIGRPTDGLFLLAPACLLASRSRIPYLARPNLFGGD